MNKNNYEKILKIILGFFTNVGLIFFSLFLKVSCHL